MRSLNTVIQEALWVAHTLFDHQKATGSTANLSFLWNGVIYISASGSCFGRLGEDDFAQLDMEGNPRNQIRPSKEFPLHQMLYQQNPTIGAVVHTHSFYAALWSCLKHENADDVIPAYTPYLKMKLGEVASVPYAPPGTRQLFDLFRQRVSQRKGYLLAHHGPVVGGSDILDAFYCIEELEESARIAWELRREKEPVSPIQPQ